MAMELQVMQTWMVAPDLEMEIAEEEADALLLNVKIWALALGAVGEVAASCFVI